MPSMSNPQEYMRYLWERASSDQERRQLECEWEKYRTMRYSFQPYTPVALPNYNDLMKYQMMQMIPAEPILKKAIETLPEEHLVSAIVGYRAWNVPLFVDELRSVAKASKWLPYQRFEAKCESSQCEGVSCSCGIYAFNKMDLVTMEYRGEGRSRKYVYGEVSLWGRVLECKNGYRAQFAYPKAFVNTGAVAKRMSEVFGVPLL